MTPISFYVDYRKWLGDLLQYRKLRNRRYSLRAFAGDIGIAAPQLSEVLNGRKGISAASAQRMSVRLGLSSSESEHFCAMVESLHSRSRAARQRASEQTAQASALASTYATLDSALFSRISGWEHYAILELCAVQHFSLTAESAAHALSIREDRAQAAIDRLAAAGLLKPSEKVVSKSVPKSRKFSPTAGTIWVKAEPRVTTSNNIPSEAIREHHRQILGKALASIDEVPTHQRDISSITMAIAVDKWDEAVKRIRNFRRELTAFLEDGECSEVYCLSTQLFPLSKLQKGH